MIPKIKIVIVNIVQVKPENVCFAFLLVLSIVLNLPRVYLLVRKSIMKTCLCNIQRFSQDVKLKFSLEKFRFFLYFRSKQTLWGHGMGSARRF